MNRNIPATRKRSLQGLSEFGSRWICQFSREEDGKGKKNKNKPCKSTDMQPRSWMGKNWVPWAEMKKDAILLAWSGRKSYCQDFRQPLNFLSCPYFHLPVMF